jgi:hypothetical protein
VISYHLTVEMADINRIMPLKESIDYGSVNNAEYDTSLANN